MINKKRIIERIDSYFGASGLFTDDTLEISFYISLSRLFEKANIILSQKVNGEAPLKGFARIHSITNETGERYKRALYQIRGEHIYLKFPNCAVVNYYYNGAFSQEISRCLIRYTEGLKHEAEQAVFYYMISDLKLQLNQQDYITFRREADRLALLCKTDKLITIG